MKRGSSPPGTVQLADMHRTVLVPASEAYPRNMGADVIALSDGTLFLAFSQWLGGTHDFDNSQVCGVLSSDRGRTWSNPFAIVRPCPAFASVRMPGLLRLNDGSIVMFARFRTSAADTWVGMIRCKDERKMMEAEANWTPPVRISPPAPGRHIHLNNRAIGLSTGRLLIPVSSPWPWDREDKRGTDIRSWCLLSDDDGASWSPSRAMLAGPKRGLMEPYVVELADHRLLMLIRTQMNAQYRSFSSDGGEAWSEAQPSTLVSPESPAAVRREPETGLLTVVWNHAEIGRHTRDRTPLTVAFSRDEGQTWFGEVHLETDASRSYSYPSLNFIEDQALVTYYEHADSRISLVLRRFKVQLSSKSTEAD